MAIEHWGGGDDDSDASFHYDDADDDEDAILTLGRTQPHCPYVVYTEGDLQTGVALVVQSIAAHVGVSADAACTMLRRCKWDTDVLKAALDNGALLDKAPYFLNCNAEMCDVCMEDMVLPYALACGHAFCAACWCLHCKAALVGGKGAVFAATCPADGCDALLAEGTFRRFLQYEDLSTSVLIDLYCFSCDRVDPRCRFVRAHPVSGVCGRARQSGAVPCPRLHQHCRLPNVSCAVSACRGLSA